MASNRWLRELDPVLPVTFMSRFTRRGVRITPAILENAALRIAAAVFPLATEVSTTEVETVEGKTHK